MKRYVRFRAVGTGEDVGTVTVEGLCDALRDPMAVAMARSVLLRRCQRVTLRTEPAFEVLCSGQRERRFQDISRQAREDQERRAVQDRIVREVAEWMQQQKLRRMLGKAARSEAEGRVAGAIPKDLPRVASTRPQDAGWPKRTEGLSDDE